MYSPGALYSPGGIFFTGRHVLSGRLYSPEGIYFTSRHVLLFRMILKKFLAPARTLRALVLSGGHLLYG